MRKSAKAASRRTAARAKSVAVPIRRRTRSGTSKAGAVFERLAFKDLVRRDPELLRSLVDQAADALCLHRIDGGILDVNRRMCVTLGYTRKELLTLSVLDIDVDSSKEETAKAASRLTPGVPVKADRVLRRKD